MLVHFVYAFFSTVKMKQSKSYLNIILTSAESIVDHSFIIEITMTKVRCQVEDTINIGKHVHKHLLDLMF